MVMPSKMLIYDHSKILEFGNVLQLIIVGYKGYVTDLKDLKMALVKFSDSVAVYLPLELPRQRISQARLALQPNIKDPRDLVSRSALDPNIKASSRAIAAFHFLSRCFLPSFPISTTLSGILTCFLSKLLLKVFTTQKKNFEFCSLEKTATH